MTGKTNSKPRFVRCPKCLNVLCEPSEIQLYKCGGCGATLQAKKRNNGTVDTASHRLDNDATGKQKVDQVFGDQIQEAGSSSNQQLQLNSNDESDQNSDHDNLHRSNKDQDTADKARNDSIEAPSFEIKEYSSGKRKIKQLSDDHEASSSLNQQPVVNSIDEPHRYIPNDPRSSTELSGHEDPESSPEATGHDRTDQEQEQNHIRGQGQDQDRSSGKQKTEQLSHNNETSSSLNQQLVVNSSELSYHENPDQEYNDDLNQVFLSCRHDVEFEESSSEFEEAYTNTKTVRSSDYGSKSSFKSLIADKLLETRPKKPVYQDENDDVLSEDGSTDLHHRRRFDRISSVETTETTRFSGTNYYGYEGSESSFDGNDNQNPRKHRISSIEDENIDRFNRRNQIHHLNNRLGKHVHRSTEIRSNYGHRAHIVSENPKLERIELLKKVRELTDQLERTNVSNPHGLNSPARYGRRMAFSGETTAVNRRLDGGTGMCHHCYPQGPHDRHFSAQLPIQAQHVCCNGPRYEPNTYYSPRVSGLSTPVHPHPESEFSTSDGGYSYSPRYKHGNGVNKTTKAFRSPMKKQYVRPIANGSPWIMCYRCYKLLELPQSFLVLNKRHHSLKCGACMKVLNFTLSNGTHVTRYYPEETIAAPPSSEVGDYNELNGSRVEPVSCSDRSFQKSYSTETDRNGSWELVERRKAAMSRDPSGSTQASSSKVSGSKVEHRPNGSPLHRLMGYATPSRVIRG